MVYFRLDTYKGGLMNLYIHSKALIIEYLTKFFITYTLFLTVLALISMISLVFFNFDLLVLLKSEVNYYIIAGALILLESSHLFSSWIRKKYNTQITTFIQKHFNSLTIVSVLKFILLLCSSGIMFVLLMSFVY